MSGYTAKRRAYYRERYERLRATDQGRLEIQVRNAVAGAIHRGDLVRPEVCEDCLRPSRSIDAHHDDYSRPLAVRWLCRSCHRTLHQGKAAA